MKRFKFFVIFTGLVIGTIYGQESGDVALRKAEKVGDWRKRFETGVHLFRAGSEEEALGIFQSNLAEDRKAKGSLFMSGVIYNRRHQFREAADHFDRLLALEPTYSAGIIGAIKAHQALGAEEAVDKYRGHLYTLKNGGKDNRLQRMNSYEREIIPLAGGNFISVQEYFQYRLGTVDPVWSYLVMKDEKSMERKLELTSVPSDELIAVKKKDETIKGVFLLSESFREEDGSPGKVKIRRIFYLPQNQPKYEEIREEVVKLLQE